jgi:hypothetical protein
VEDAYSDEEDGKDDVGGEEISCQALGFQHLKYSVCNLLFRVH